MLQNDRGVELAHRYVRFGTGKPPVTAAIPTWPVTVWCVCEAVSLLLKSTVRVPLHVNELLHKNMTKMMFTPTFVDILHCDERTHTTTVV